MLGSLEANSMIDVTHPDPSLFCYSNSIELHLNLSAKENPWLSSILSVEKSQPFAAMYVAADSKSQREVWEHKFKEIVMHTKSEMKMKPALPPRGTRLVN